MKILYVASEIHPYASTGGLADVAGSLPIALARLGHQVQRVMPMYRTVLARESSLENLNCKLEIPVGFRGYRGDVWKSNDDGVETFFIRRDEYFDRSQIYNLPNRDYDDNLERFIFFQKAVVSLIDTLGLAPQIVHGNDWQCGLLPSFLQHGVRGVGRHRREKFLFTIHNLGFQGVFSGNDFSFTNLPFNAFSVDTMEYYGNMNLLKNGITCADRITTVSRSYARDIQTEAHGLGLHGVLSQAKDRLTGIPNGIDVAAWDPETDELIAESFDADNLSGKKACREQLLKAFGIRSRPGVPVVGFMGRLTEEKGLDLLGDAIAALAKMDVILLILGRGDTAHEKACVEWAQTWPDRIACKIAFDESAGRQLIAGCDMLLMPSKSEPCGLSQLKAMRYGTVPVVHAVGGLCDTVQDVEESAGKGVGFTYAKHQVEDLLTALSRAMNLHQDAAGWSALMRRAMSVDVSWDKAAREYADLMASMLK